MEVKRVGVVGCGQMGSGIAEVSARSGYQVTVLDMNEELLNKGLERIKSSLGMGVKRGKLTESEKETTLSRLKGTTNMADFKSCDIVMEAIMENLAEKKKIFSALDSICLPHTILSSNTSCLSILDMAMVTKRPTQVIGIHFFNPVPVMRLVEVVKTILSGEDTINAAKQFCQSLGKVVVVAKDSPGFIVNRLLVPYILDAIRMLESGGAIKEDIDQGVVLGTNSPMGPLTLADFIGLDTMLFIADAMYNEFREPKYVAPTLLRKMVLAGQYGRKTGKGFYDYK